MKTPQEQAEYLADYCTLQLSISGHTFPGHVCGSKETITKSIPLTELIAVAQAAANDKKDEECTCSSDPERSCRYCGYFIHLDSALHALRATGKVEL